jgi:hypothetical protein
MNMKAFNHQPYLLAWKPQAGSSVRRLAPMFRLDPTDTVSSVFAGCGQI